MAYGKQSKIAIQSNPWDAAQRSFLAAEERMTKKWGLGAWMKMARPELAQKYRSARERYLNALRTREAGVVIATCENLVKGLKVIDQEISQEHKPDDVFYLHAPDAAVPVEETLQAVQAAFEAGKFRRFALSNFTAWETVWIHNYMTSKGWIAPSIYQGMMNAITRRVADELFPALRRLGMSFYAYNPLAGGMLTGKHTRDSAKVDGRFNGGTVWGKVYQQRFMQEKQFDALDVILPACAAAGIPPAEAALRWAMHHSPLDGAKGDAVMIGASKLAYFEQNMAALAKGPLPAEVVAAYDQGWETCRAVAPNFSRGYSGGGSSYL